MARFDSISARTIQKLLKHSALRTTMVTTHTITISTLEEKKNPLDLIALQKDVWKDLSMTSQRSAH